MSTKWGPVGVAMSLRGTLCSCDGCPHEGSRVLHFKLDGDWWPIRYRVCDVHAYTLFRSSADAPEES